MPVHKPCLWWDREISGEARWSQLARATNMGFSVVPPRETSVLRLLLLLTVYVPLTAFASRSEVGAAEPQAPVRGVLVRPGRVTPEFLAAWKAKGASALVVPLDEATKPRWETIAKSVERAGMTLWPWVEVA